jgi:integrase
LPSLLDDAGVLGPRSRADARPPWVRVRKAAKLPAPLPTIHSLRHSAAAWWLAAGLTVNAVAELLGHSDPTLVIKRYGHALPAERRTAGERLEAFLEASATG